MMRVEQLPGLEHEQITRLRVAGIGNCRQLLRASQRQERFLNLVRSTELPLETLCGVVQRAELCQIRGIGPANLTHLVAVGIDSLAALAGQNPERLQAQLQGVTARPPNLAVIEHWIQQARRYQGRRPEALSQTCGTA